MVKGRDLRCQVPAETLCLTNTQLTRRLQATPPLLHSLSMGTAHWTETVDAILTPNLGYKADSTEFYRIAQNLLDSESIKSRMVRAFCVCVCVNASQAREAQNLSPLLMRILQAWGRGCDSGFIPWLLTPSLGFPLSGALEPSDGVSEQMGAAGRG